MRLALVGVLLLGTVACSGGSSPSSPSNPTPTPPASPTLQAVTLSNPQGNLTRAGSTSPIRATGNYSDGSVKDLTTSCSGWTADNTFVLTIDGNGVVTAQHSGASTVTTACQGVFARVLLTLTLIPDTPFFQSGSGDSVFTLPSYVSRVKITGDYGGYCQNFIVHIAGTGLVNVILGNCNIGQGSHFEGTYATAGGLVEIVNSNTVKWTFTEIR